MSTRREFLHNIGLLGAAGTVGLATGSLQAAPSNTLKKFQPVKFGIIADIHHGVLSDVGERLEKFLRQVETEKPDFVISLGDFTAPLPKNKAFAEKYRSAKCPAYHILGNHDLDAVGKKEAVAFLKMPAAYYSFDVSGWHFVVLDPNYIFSDGKFRDYEKGNYFRMSGKCEYINDEQCEWLAADLRATKSPTFLFSHQSFLHDKFFIRNREKVMKILEQENKRAGFRKIIGNFSGHIHDNEFRVINGIHYFSINSASYWWHDQKVRGRYPVNMRKKNQLLDNIMIYKDPLFCFVTIDESGHFSLRGQKSQWLVPMPDIAEAKDSRVVPYIGDYETNLS
jgi:3',5'-cyclic AMP phosphodiesterase CpdA